ncbi:MAG: glycerol-3-phosphate 1-O-acyltransferase PlsY [Bdellovibrionota bacterium]
MSWTGFSLDLPSIGLASLSFLVGSIPFGVLITRALGRKNPRQEGSGNIGATNVSRVAGFWPAGLFTLVLDVSKGALPIFLASAVGVSIWAPWVTAEGLLLGKSLQWRCGVLGVLGHCYSPWLRFEGGKGVATAFGVFFALTPISAGIALFTFIIVFLQTRVVSISSLSGMAVLLISDLALYPIDVHSWVIGFIVFLVMIRHESNIDALLAETEKSVP